MHETLAFDEVEREQPKTSDPKYQRAKRKTPKKGRKKKSHAEEEKKEEVSTGVDKDGIPEPLDEAASDKHASAQHAEVKNAIVPHKSLSSAVYSVKEVSPAGMGYAQGPALLSPVLEGKQMLGSDGLPEWVHRGPYTGIRKQLRSVVSDMFEGKLRSTVRCRSCGYKSPKDDTFWDLSLPIPKRSVAAAAATD
ncbi:usp44, partial [Symbiodinium sp. KB8]